MTRRNALIILAGGVVATAFAVAAASVTLREDGGPTPSTIQGQVPVAPEARGVALEFLRSVVMRENLRRGWAISGRGVRQDFTLREWITGEVPVFAFPDAAVDHTSVRIDWSYPSELALSVVLKPRRPSSRRPRIVYLLLDKVRRGGRAVWVVTAATPDAPPHFPSRPPSGHTAQPNPDHSDPG
jgi:hypothetical protein